MLPSSRLRSFQEKRAEQHLAVIFIGTITIGIWYLITYVGEAGAKFTSDLVGVSIVVFLFALLLTLFILFMFRVIDEIRLKFYVLPKHKIGKHG